MREILFRGKRKTDGIWLHGDLRQWSETRKGICDYSLRGTSEVHPETVGQFTGLTDKDGNKIFDGDVVCYTTPDDSRAFGIVRFGEYGSGGSCHVGFGVDWFGRHDTGWLRCDIGFWVKFREIKVIGNIHDNPELLEG